jgi:hypothetical protein
MRAPPLGDAGQGWGVSGVGRVGGPCGVGRPLRALRTPSTCATPVHIIESLLLNIPNTIYLPF